MRARGRRSARAAEPGEILEPLEAGQEEIRAAAAGGERRQPLDRSLDRPLRNLVLERAVVGADERVALVAELVEVLVVDPDVLRELELPDQARAQHERGDAALDTVLRRACGQLRAVGAAAPDHAPPVH